MLNRVIEAFMKASSEYTQGYSWNIIATKLRVETLIRNSHCNNFHSSSTMIAKILENARIVEYIGLVVSLASHDVSKPSSPILEMALREQSINLYIDTPLLEIVKTSRECYSIESELKKRNIDVFDRRIYG
jgi:hypothetical protein